MYYADDHILYTMYIFIILQHGFTALHWAIQIVYHSVINVLLQCGASLTVKNKVRACTYHSLKI